MALVGEILRQEHEGEQHLLVGLRTTLGALHEGLFVVYMTTGKVQHR